MPVWMYRIAAELVFLFHAGSILIIGLGWAIPALLPVHIALLFGGLFLQLILGHCFLSRWEFWLRKKVDPSIAYDAAYITHYMRVLFGNQIRPQFMRVAVPSALVALASIHAVFYWYTQFA